LVIAVLSREVEAAHDDGPYLVQRLEKSDHVVRHQRRDASCVRADWELCPASVGGGCCPSGYSCGESLCTATTAGPSGSCSQADYYQCPAERGGGCCPVGTICDEVNDTCNPTNGDTSAPDCPENYFACPASLGLGCCQNGMACGVDTCYATRPSTLPVSFAVTTTNSDGDAVTSTRTTQTVITPGLPAATVTAATGGAPKLIQSTLTKMAAIETGTSSSGPTLSNAGIGGIVAGVVVVLIAIIVATVLIIRRLKSTERAVAGADSKRGSSNGQQRPQKPGFGQPSVSEVGAFDIDPLMRSPSIRPSHFRTESDSSVAERSPTRNQNFHGTTSPTPWPGVYDPIPTSDTPDSRGQSIDGAHDATRQAHGGSERTSCDSAATGMYTRHWSNASEVSGSIDGAHGTSELDANDVVPDRRRRSSSATGTTQVPMAHVRRVSEGRGRSESSAAAVQLGTVNEEQLHGYYGPPDHAVGQTGHALRRGFSSVSSTPVEAYRRHR
jgi:hypothetical protein